MPILRGMSDQVDTPSGDTGARLPKRVIAISSGKGGVGKSSVTVNLALSLQKMGNSVGILDADVYGFSIPKMLGISSDPSTIGDKVVPPVAYGVKCISIGSFARDDQPIMWRGPLLHRTLNQFVSDVLWGDLDFLVVDMPPGTGDVALSMAEFLPHAEVLVVTTPQPAAQRVAQRSALAALKAGLDVRGVIENMSYFVGDSKRYEIFGSGGGAQLAADLGVDLLAQIPLEVELREGGDAGVPIVESTPASESSRAFMGLAQAVTSQQPRRRYRSELKVN